MALRLPSPPEPVIDDPPRQFPDWMRRIDPLLAAEDTNTLYRAFLLRRTVHRGKGLRTFAERWRDDKFRWGVIVLNIALLFVITAAWCWGVIVPVVLTIIAVTVLVRVIDTALRATAVRSSKLPLHLGMIFIPFAPAKEPARDVWALGRPVEELLEALYLEQREQQLGSAKWVVPLLMLLVVGLFTLAAVELDFTRFRPTMLITQLGIIVLIGALAAWGETLGRVTSARSMMRLILSWKFATSKSDYARYARGCMMGCLGNLGYLAVITVPALLGLAALGYLGYGTVRVLHFVTIRVAQSDGYAFAGLIMLVVSATILAVVIVSQKADRRIWELVLLRAPFLYDAWMASEIFGDPDGYTAAVAKHGMGDEDRMSAWRARQSWFRALSSWS